MRVTDPFGRTLTFTYDAADRIATLTDPAGGVYTYSYDAKNNLSFRALSQWRNPYLPVRRYAVSQCADGDHRMKTASALRRLPMTPMAK